MLPLPAAVSIFRRAARVLAGVACALALSGPAAGQGRLDPDRYLSLLGETRGGLFITSGRALAAHAGASVEPVVARFLESAPQPLVLKTAALLHTEAAFLPGDGAEIHLEMARRLLGALPDPAERESWLRRWWLAVCYSYHVSLNSTAGVAAFESALEDLPGDRRIRIAKAAMLQMAGRQREEEAYLISAGNTLLGLLEETPDDPDLRVRVAAVRLDLGDPEGAAAELERLGDARLAPLTRVASLLVRGEIALDAGRPEEAETHFEAAVRRARRSPAAVAGLVTARLALGDAIGAREAAEALVGRPPLGWEPEWQYWLGPALEFQDMFNEMKAEVRAAESQ